MTAVLASSCLDAEEIFLTIYFQQVTQYQFFTFLKLFCTPSPDQRYSKANGIRATEIPGSTIYTIWGKTGITGMPMNTRKKKSWPHNTASYQLVGFNAGLSL